MNHECKQENFLGQVKEFMNSYKGTKALQFTVVGVIIVQVGAFLVMWGSLTTTVKVHDKNINFLMSKFNNIKLIGYVNAEEK
jgi:hypothetical protein